MRGVSFRLQGMSSFRMPLSRRAAASPCPSSPPFRPSRQADYPDQGHPHHRAVRARRLGRHHLAADRQVHRGQDRPALRGREQAGRQRHRRRARRQGGAGRRLHADAGHHLDQRRQHPHVQEPGLRPGEGLPGGGRHRLERRLPRRAGRQPLQDARRPARLRQGQSRQAELRLLQRKLAGAGGGPGQAAPASQWQAVAYKAIGNAWTDLYAGAIQFMFVDLTAGRGQVVANKARPLAITLPKRSPLYPDLPTLARELSRASPAPASSPSPCRRPRRGRSRRS